MGEKQIKIVITDGEKEAKTSISVEDYQMTKELHGVSLIDEQVDVLLNEIKKTSKQTAVEWLGLELNMIFHDITPELWEEVELKFQQAKQMEKDQIIGAYDREVIDDIQNWFIGNGEKYYNLHYRGNKEKYTPEPNQNYTFEDGV